MKWGKEKFEGLELSTEEPPIVFKGQLFALTNVPPDRQKVMLGGATIGDQEWGKAQPKIKDVSGELRHFRRVSSVILQCTAVS